MLKIMSKRKKQKGFTLVELLLVIAIIGILAAVLFVGLGSQRQRARATAFKESMRNLAASFAVCVDGRGAIGGLVNDDDLTPGSSFICGENSSGISTDENIPAIKDCDGDGNVSINVKHPGQRNWIAEAICDFDGDSDYTEGTDCKAVCQMGGCVFEGKCD